MRVQPLGPEQVVEAGEWLVLVDCGDGLAGRWREAGLPARGPDVVLITEPEPERIAGLFAVLAAARAARRGREMALVHHLSDERTPLLAEAFLRAFGADFPLRLEPETPGARLAFGELEVQLRPSLRGVGYRLERAGQRLEFRAGHEA